ncbi:TPA: quinone-dependent dihydroorotate dehydrogenase [Candidatus Uhrbacteria bacterium]|nr:quinone-dependent dihydroorotate dehydrogenase [Candidatus Uhrbacteria bacterium]
MFATKLQRLGYRHFCKPFFFRRDPEWTHDAVCLLGEYLGRYKMTRAFVRGMYVYEHPSLQQTILGISFPNPIGLTEGFDKDAHLTRILPNVGFGYEVIGSVTAEPCEGNARPRLWRLSESQALVVYYGLKNDGSDEIYHRLKKEEFKIPLGISIAKTNSPQTVELSAGIQDYLKGFTRMLDVGHFFVINISCPNAFGGEPFNDPVRLDALLTQLDSVKTDKPLFLKIAADLSFQELDRLISVMDRHRVHGMILSNLTKKYDRPEIRQGELQPFMKGGISGRPTFQASNSLIAHAYLEAGDRYIIIGAGGIFTAEDAYEKIRQGASLVQLATGMIFEGPQLIGELNKGLVERIQRDGFQNIQQVIGSAHKKSYA